MKKLTKKQEQMVENYRRVLNYCGVRGVKDCYKTPSVDKTRAEYFIKNEMQDINEVTQLFASDYTVVGHSTMMFSCAYSVYASKLGKGAYICRAVVYYTAYNRYIIPFDDTIEQELEEVLR